jgi:molybdate transport system ATP-binding protein
VSGSTLSADLRVRRGSFDLDLELTVQPGEVVALLGPNGAGKSTALRLLAGLLPLDDGTVRLGRTVVEDTVARVRLEPEQRQVGVVFQDYLLFPHLTARENVAFGLRARGLARREARERADDWLARVGLAEHADRKPRQLSGGQAQRVALARALAAEPRLLLLDEPLAALDAGTRMEVRADLRHHLGSFDGATVVVTHDALDAMVLADRLVVVEDGRVVQSGAPREVSAHPRTDYVARLVGLNLLAGSRCRAGSTSRAGRRSPRPAMPMATCSSPSRRTRWPCTGPGRTAAPGTAGRPGWRRWSRTATPCGSRSTARSPSWPR